MQQKNLEELLSSLQDLSSNPQMASASARMVEWHSKLGELRLVEMRLTRANQRQRERVAQLEALVGGGEKEFSRLEQRLIALTKVCTIFLLLFFRFLLCYFVRLFHTLVPVCLFKWDSHARVILYIPPPCYGFSSLH